jgi:hypothetical protein
VPRGLHPLRPNSVCSRRRRRRRRRRLTHAADGTMYVVVVVVRDGPRLREVELSELVLQPGELLIVPGAASAASFQAAQNVSTEIYLCNVCSCQERLRRHGSAAGSRHPAPGDEPPGLRGAGGQLHRRHQPGGRPQPPRDGGERAVSILESVHYVTEIYLRHACSDHEVEDGNGASGAGWARSLRPAVAGAAPRRRARRVCFHLGIGPF